MGGIYLTEQQKNSLLKAPLQTTKKNTSRLTTSPLSKKSPTNNRKQGKGDQFRKTKTKIKGRELRTSTKATGKRIETLIKRRLRDRLRSGDSSARDIIVN